MSRGILFIGLCAVLVADGLALAQDPSAKPQAKANDSTIDVSNDQELRQSLRQVKPGTTIRIAPGTYSGGIWAEGLRGAPDQPILLQGADPKRPPLIRGGSFGLHLASVAYVELRDLAVEKASGNGINIDDGGKSETPSHHVTLRRLTVREIGPSGNRDGIKLSGLDDFRVEGCVIERWGSGGSGIDMVGCHRGEIVDSTFRHGDNEGGNGVQAKGGSSAVAVRRCRFDRAGQRAINLGGSTGSPYFRPSSPGHEAKDITVEDCFFVGSMTPIAFVGVDGATVRHNTIYRPKRWGLRILQENTAPGLAPCRNGSFTDNLIVFRSDEMAVPVNIGPGTAPETFTFARNAWYCLDAPQRSRPRLPVSETEGVYGVDPQLRDPERGDLRRPVNPATPQLKSVGARQGHR